MGNNHKARALINAASRQMSDSEELSFWRGEYEEYIEERKKIDDAEKGHFNPSITPESSEKPNSKYMARHVVFGSDGGNERTRYESVSKDNLLELVRRWKGDGYVYQVKSYKGCNAYYATVGEWVKKLPSGRKMKIFIEDGERKFDSMMGWELQYKVEPEVIEKLLGENAWILSESMPPISPVLTKKDKKAKSFWKRLFGLK